MSDGARWAIAVGVFFLAIIVVDFVLLMALMAASPNLGPIELAILVLIGVAVAFPVSRTVYRKLGQ